MNQPNPFEQDKAVTIAALCQILLQDQQPQIRAQAAITLGDIGRDSAMTRKALYQALLKDDNLIVQVSVMIAISKIYTPNPSVPTVSDAPSVQMTFNAPVTGVAGNVAGDFMVSSLNPNIATAAQEIQSLLEQLAQGNPAIIGKQEQAIVLNTLQQEIKRNPTLKSRLLSALKAGGAEALKIALEKFFNSPLVSISVETVKGWIEAE
jgi:hypothetical protein